MRTWRPTRCFRCLVPAVLPVFLCTYMISGESCWGAVRIEKVITNTCGEVRATSETKFGFYVFAGDDGAQLAVMPSAGTILAVLPARTHVTLSLRVSGSNEAEKWELAVTSRVAGAAHVSVSFGQTTLSSRVTQDKPWTLPLPKGDPSELCEVTINPESDTSRAVLLLELRNLGQLPQGDLIELTPGDPQVTPPPVCPNLHPEIQTAMIEWDWRQQDALDSCSPSLEAVHKAIARLIQQGDVLVDDLSQMGVQSDLFAQWRDVCGKWRNDDFQKDVASDVRAQLAVWQRIRTLKRQIALLNPYLAGKKLVFVKHVPSMFSHQLTQYTGNCARPGGGLFVLEEPGRSMLARNLISGNFPLGSYQFCDVSPDGKKVLFSFCEVPSAPPDREAALDRFFHLWEMDWDTRACRRLTDGSFDHFAGKYLADGRIVCVSTRRGGFHRCGRGPCPVHTLTLLERDGSNARVISFHETHEWDPVQLLDGRILYTRWDYVDRNAVFYQQLWTVRSDGTYVQAYYGNNTFNPVGIWEARPIPGTHAVMGTAAAHHAMTAGSIIRLDVCRGIDGPEPITRLTPDALFPESEVPVINRSGGRWFNPVGVTPPPLPEEQKRFPGHCYRTPFPLSEKYFLVAYSYDPLIGEPDANQVNMFGIYLMDVFGNKELLYRDLNISSLWPVVVGNKPGTQPGEAKVAVHLANHIIAGADEVASQSGRVSPTNESSPQAEGEFLLTNVYTAWPRLPPVKITRLRIVQVLPKSTWHANDPPLGLPNISPGKQVLGTVPVEPDGSAYFRAPAGKALSFQALDEMGQAVQIMRSVTYVQPGEIASCIGCHEPRNTAPAISHLPLAATRPPSEITPGPPGSRPLSFPILVQPVLDRHCVRCHGENEPGGGIVLSGVPQGRYTKAYLALAPQVPYADWAGRPGDFRVVNSEPVTQPDFFGARGSKLLSMLLEGHYDVHLDQDDLERLVTWMDCNALFYGTFNPEDQKRQQKGEVILGPALE
ncbi:MAG TPA: hypothetical protein PKI05_00630 [Thermogutta sp.]|nr:hypothetical protein [Thermogutta sp.]